MKKKVITEEIINDLPLLTEEEEKNVVPTKSSSKLF